MVEIRVQHYGDNNFTQPESICEEEISSEIELQNMKPQYPMLIYMIESYNHYLANIRPYFDTLGWILSIFII